MQILSIPEKPPEKHVSITAGEHLIGEFVGDARGATLIVFGSVHGNEAGGALALQKISGILPAFAPKLRGRVYFLAGNTRAIAKGVRFIDSDLNRHWSLENIKHNRPHSQITTKRAEDLEQTELLTILENILTTARGEVYALDLHSTSADGVPFATVGDTLRNRDFAQKFPITILLGIEEQLDGTILEYLNNLGTVTLGYEGGQHFAGQTIKNHEALCWLALVNSGILPKEDLPDFEKHEEILKDATGARRIVEIRYRHAITETDEFKMELGYENFQPVKHGEVLANDRRGAIRAGESGLILMPLYQSLGEDGFFLGREVAPFWLKLSGFLRRLNVAGLMRFFPGVRKSPFDDETLEINTRIAWLFPLQIFHLLGFRKRRWRDNKLIVSRRKFDTKSPFVKNQE
ncbi:MAG TPA: succinylglutamate desuccinylase/aspartoacylase family protein [Pyrinomonadaceae bacterium]|nr:succinylglutamate desuccinylase/aspartoacylase family protein [Pyrinomonadaceae bacterium]